MAADKIPDYGAIFEKTYLKKGKGKEIENDKYGLKHPFRLAVIGGSNSGKTTAMAHLLLNYVKYEHIYIYARDLEESIYKGLMKKLDLLQEEHELENSLYTASDDPEMIIDVADLDRNVRSVMIIDDMVSSAKARPRIFELFLRGRKKNASLIFVSQSFFQIQKEVRLQLSALMIMKLNDKTDLNAIAQRASGDIKKEKFLELHRRATKKPFGFILYDMAAPTIAMKYRDGFTKPLINQKNETSSSDDA